MRIFVCPGSDQPFARARQTLQQPKDGVGIAIGPAADRVDRDLDIFVAFAHRAVAVEIIAPLMAEPVKHPQPVVVEALTPHVAPALADDFRIRRRLRDGEGGCAPSQLIGQNRTAHEMDVVCVAVVGRAQSDHGLQRRWAPGRHLQAVEPAQEIPIIPTVPLHQGRAASQSITARQSSCSWSKYSPWHAPSLSPLPRMSTRTPA